MRKLTPHFILKFFTFIFLLNSQNIFSQVYQWRVIETGPTASSTRFEDVYFINNNTGWIIDIDGLVYKTNNGGKNWSQIYSQAFAGYRSIAFFDSSYGVLGTLDSDSTLFTTTNGGLNWTLNTNITGTMPHGICGISIAGPNLVFASGRYDGFATVIKSTNRGVTWTSLNIDNKATSLIDCYFQNENTGFVCGGLGGGFSSRRTVILRTTNSGLTWDSVYLSTTSGEWGWKFSFINSTTGYCSVERSGTATYYAKTTNGGANWFRQNYNFFPVVQGICFLNENTGWVGGGHEFPPPYSNTFGTTNGGVTWVGVPNLLNVNVFQLLSDTLGFAVGNRVYRYGKDSIVNIENISNIIPTKFELKQNYPNPFNPSTNFEFRIADFGFVKLKIFNNLGKEVERLVNQNLNAGTYKVQWDASEYSSGVYYYKLETEKFSETKKLLLIK
ncbi:MAG TPA: T9SS type A sorting domain-containing protein [Ignavibacteria bacterium]|nr:T9SS type A sorting domain-containing protein [Ignavibacteria bacterium]